MDRARVAAWMSAASAGLLELVYIYSWADASPPAHVLPQHAIALAPLFGIAIALYEPERAVFRTALPVGLLVTTADQLWNVSQSMRFLGDENVIARSIGPIALSIAFAALAVVWAIRPTRPAAIMVRAASLIHLAVLGFTVATMWELLWWPAFPVARMIVAANITLGIIPYGALALALTPRADPQQAPTK